MILQFSRARPGVERWHSNAVLPRHRHDHGYITVVLAGTYMEAGEKGRFHLVPGDVIFHDRYEAHRNVFSRAGAELLNIPLRDWRVPAFAVGTVDDPDFIARAAETDLVEAEQLLRASLKRKVWQASDWMDALAIAILHDPDTRLEKWAQSRRLSPETVSRGFKRAFGISPRRFRADIRAQRALRALSKGRDSLSQIAAETGFSDQSHMTRALVALTGKTPRQFRRAESSENHG